MTAAARCIAAAGILALAAGCLPTHPPPPDETRLSVAPGFGSDSDGRLEAWRRYAVARIEGPVGGQRRGSVDPPGFAEEVFARDYMVRAWSELARTRGYRDAYLEDLARVEQEGYLREYAWTCLHVLRGLEPDDLELAGFRDWLRRVLPEHRVETWVSAHIEGDRVHFEVGRPAHAPYRCASAG